MMLALSVVYFLDKDERESEGKELAASPMEGEQMKELLVMGLIRCNLG